MERERFISGSATFLQEVWAAEGMERAPGSSWSLWERLPTSPMFKNRTSATYFCIPGYGYENSAKNNMKLLSSSWKCWDNESFRTHHHMSQSTSSTMPYLTYSRATSVMQDGNFNQLGVGESKRLMQILPCRGSLEQQLYPLQVRWRH